MIPQLKNWNTIVGFAVIALAGAAWNLGYIEESTVKWIAVALIPYTGISLRAASGKR